MNFYFSIKLKKIFKIESQNDLNELEEIFCVDINTRFNSTSLVNEDIIWTKNDLNIVEDIYKKDFKLFDYKKKS